MGPWRWSFPRTEPGPWRWVLPPGRGRPHLLRDRGRRIAPPTPEERLRFQEIALAIWQVAVVLAVEQFFAGGDEPATGLPLEAEDIEWAAGFGWRAELGAQSIEDYWRHYFRR